jgi:hypothetical protein
VFSQGGKTDENAILKYLAIKIITATLITMRLLTLFFLLYTLAVSVWYFTKAKRISMRAKGEYGLSKLNYAIISLIYLLITLRLVMYITINILTVELICLFNESQSHDDP